MAENKTQPTEASVDAYLAAIDEPTRRSDCEALLALMVKLTQVPPVMWGTGIVGFGSYHCAYASGRQGDMCRTGFSSRKNGISIYFVASSPNQGALLRKLGKHKMGVACLTFKRLNDVDRKVLEALIAGSYAEVNRRYP